MEAGAFKNHFDTSIVIFSKIQEDLRYFVFFVKRPQILRLQIKYYKDEIYIIVPYDFMPSLVFKSPFWPQFIDTILYGSIVKNNDADIEKIRLFIVGYVTTVLRRRKKSRRIFEVVKAMKNYLKTSKSYTPQIINSFFNLANDCYIGNFNNLYIGGHAFKKQIPEPVRKASDSLLVRKISTDLSKLLSDIHDANNHFIKNKFIFLMIKEDNDYDEIISHLLVNCKGQIDFLIKECGFFFWLDKVRKRIVIKLSNIENKYTVPMLLRIDSEIKTVFKKEILQPVKSEVIKIREEYCFRNYFLEGLENNIIHLAQNLINKDRDNLMQLQIVRVFFEILIQVVSDLKKSKQEEFLGSLLQSWTNNTFSFKKNRLSFFNYERILRNKEIKKRKKFEYLSHLGFYNLKDHNFDAQLMHLKEDLHRTLTNISKFKKINLLLNDDLDLFPYSNKITEKDMLTFRQLRNFFETLSLVFGISDSDKEFAAFSCLEVIRNKSKQNK